MATLPFSIQPRNGETVEQFNKRIQKARTEFIKQHRPGSVREQQDQKQAHEHSQHTHRRSRRRGAPDTYPDSVVTSIRAMWLAGVRHKDIAFRLGVTDNTVRYLCDQWDKRPDCIPSLQEIAIYSVYPHKLPDGPMLNARLSRWIAAVTAKARTSRPEQS